MSYYCNHCDSTFQYDGEGDVVCPRCGAGVVCSNRMLVHGVNEPMNIGAAGVIIKWLGWRGFKKAQQLFAEMHPELRPISRKLAAKQKEEGSD